MTSWLKDIRKTALLAGITGVLSLVIPAYEELPKLAAIDPQHMSWWAFPFIVLALIVSPILLVFDFALYLDKGTLSVSRRLRALSLAGASTSGISMVITIPAWVRLFGAGPEASILTSGREPWTLVHLSALLLGFSKVGAILLLIALSKSPEESSTASVSVSKLLRVVATIAATVWGLCISLMVLRLLMTPYTYIQMRDLALQFGRTPVTLPYLISDAARTLLEQFGFFVAPFVVWRSISAAPKPSPVGPEH
jgi:hypothetical protein